MVDVPPPPKRNRLMDALAPKAAFVEKADLPETEAKTTRLPSGILNEIINRPTDNMSKRDGGEEIVNLNFKVPKPLFRSFGIMAKELDMKNNAFLVELLDFYTKANAERFGNLSPEMQRRYAELQKKAKKG